MSETAGVAGGTLVLHAWGLDVHGYAVRLGAASMGVRLSLRTDRAAETDGPVLLDSGQALPGAGAILRHLAELPVVAPAWRQPAPDGWETLAAALLAAFCIARRDRLAGDLTLDQAIEAGDRLLRPLEDRLADGAFDGCAFLGRAVPAIADLLAFPAAALAPDLGLPLDLYPALRAYVRAMRARPGFLTMPGIPSFG